MAICPTAKEKLPPALDRLVRRAVCLAVMDSDTIAIDDLLMPLDTVRGQAADTLELPAKLILAHRCIVSQNMCSVKGGLSLSSFGNWQNWIGTTRGSAKLHHTIASSCGWHPYPPNSERSPFRDMTKVV